MTENQSSDNRRYVKLADLEEAVKRLPTYEAAHGGYKGWLVVHKRDLMRALEKLASTATERVG